MIKTHSVYNQLYKDKEKFVILVTGGRGSGKSFATGTFIERLTFELGEDEGRKIPHIILYSRYTMVSAQISVIPEFLEKIEYDGTGKYFYQTKSDIVNRRTDAKIMFRGIKTSSGNQTAKLKSIHGLTTFVCDEGEEWTSEKEFETIMFSIRQRGLQNRIIIIMNPTDSNHFIYQKYIKDTHKLVEYDGVPVQISTHPNVLHIHTSYLDNLEHLNDQFVRDAKMMKERDPERYAHVFMGRWADVAEGAIFKKWGIVKEFPSWAKKVACGADWGFSCDPSACVKCGIVDNDLYIDEQFYRVGMLTTDLIREFREIGLFVYSDSADPRLIQEIANGGVVIYPVAKPSGSIIASIEKLKTFDNIYVTERSLNLQNELRNYTWAKDKDGNYINEPIDAYNHCFVGDTKIVTDRGDRMLADIAEGEMVLTSRGFKRVLKKFDNGVKKVVRFKINEIEIEGTPDHLVKTDKGWRKLEELRVGDKLYNTQSKNVAQGCVEENIVKELTILEMRTSEVYDLMVEDCHEYFANGILVHNCIDAVRYYINGHILGQIVKPRRVNKDDLGIF